jgi:N-acetylmuramoyl-L-alanine amidase
MYREALSQFETLAENPEKQKDRLNWMQAVSRFKSLYKMEPRGPWADDALFMIGRIFSELHKRFSDPQDKQEAVDYYRRLIRRFPESPRWTETRKAIADLQEEREEPPEAKGASPSVEDRGEMPETDEEALLAAEAQQEEAGARVPVPEEEAPPEKKRSGPSGSQLSEVTNLRFWSNPSYTRVVIDLEEEVSYTYRLLKKDPAIGKPQRFYVDLKNTRMGGELKPIVPIGDDLLSSARAGQYRPDTVRVVLDIKSIENFKIFSLSNPFRIVLDVNGKAGKYGSKGMPPEGPPPSGSAAPDGSLAKQLALGVRRIVIDPGHGGKDPGAIGCQRGVLEKNVALEVSKRLARAIEEKLGCEVILTRDRDVFLSLEERTAIANTKNADIFISVHANAHRSRHVRGIETYILNLATDNDAIMLAARENATSTKTISDLEAILNSLMNNAKVGESSRLASAVQRGITRSLRGKHKGIRDNGVKQAPFYVLLGAKMPCILLELGFLTNPEGCRRLNSSSYQQDVVEGIVAGLKDYIAEISPSLVTKLGDPGA